MEQEDLNEVIRKHKLWIDNEDGGEKANLRRANLRGAGLTRADLRWANLRGVDLQGSNLRGADLRGAGLTRADLKGANLTAVDLEGANLEWADLRYSPNFTDIQGNQPVYQAVCGFGSRNSTLTLLAIGEEKDWQFFTGCFKGNKEELVEAVERKYGGVEREKYVITINHLLTIAKLNNQPIEINNNEQRK